jgi:hypothetical protein
MGLAVGMLTAVSASAFAAREVIDTKPIEALRGEAFRAMATTRLRLLLLGLACAGVALAIPSLLPPGSIAGNASVVALHVALVVISRPVVVWTAARIAPRVPIGRDPAIGLAARLLSGTPTRAAIAVSLLSLALAIAIAASTIERSLVGSMRGMLSAMVRADLVLSSGVMGIGRLADPLDRSIAQTLRAIPEIADVELHSMLDTEVNGERTALIALSPGFFTADRYGRLLPAGADKERVLNEVRAGRAVFVSHGFAARRGVQAGDRISVATNTSPLTMPIAAIATEYFSDEGAVILVDDLYTRQWGARVANEFHLLLQPGVGVETARERIAEAFGASHRFTLLTLGEVIAVHASRISQAFAFVFPHFFGWTARTKSTTSRGRARAGAVLAEMRATSAV